MEMEENSKTTSILGLVHPSMDDDYVKAFQEYSKLAEKISRRSATMNESLRLSILQSAMNHHGRALEHAQDAIVSLPSSGDSKYQIAAAYILVAYAKAGCIESQGEIPSFKSLRDPLMRAKEHLESLLHYSKESDEDARVLLKALNKLLSDCASENEIRRRMDFDAKRFK